MKVVMSMAAAALMSVSAAGSRNAQDGVLQALSKSRRSLGEGIKQLTKDSEVAISGKFEMEDGKLSLSVYTAEKGLGADPEHNVLKEFAGSPEAVDWKPNAEVFKDVEHVSRASMQLTIMAMAKVTLLDVIARAEKDQKGVIYSVNPVLRDRRAVIVVLVAVEGRSVELCYDALTGDAVKR